MMKHIKVCSLISVFVLLITISYSYLKYEEKDLNLLAVNYNGNKTYRAVFDFNYGELVGFDNENFDKLNDGLYGMKNDITINGVKNSKRGNYYILYWSLDHKCSTKDLEVGAENTVNNNEVYYACYEQKDFDNNGNRYVLSNAFVSGENVSCGDVVHVTTCYKKKVGSELIDYCEYDKVNEKTSSGVVYRMRLAVSKPNSCDENLTAYFYETKGSIGMKCDKTIDADLGICSSSGKKGEKVYTPNTSNLVYNDRKFIGWAADDDGKNINCSGKLLNSSKVTLNENVNYYACYEEKEECENTKDIKNGKGSYEVKVCYETVNKYGELLVEPKSDDFDEILTCADGYTLDKVSKSNIIETTCKQEGDCYRIYDLSCVGERPKISAKIGVVSDNGYGEVVFSGSSDVGIKGYYASSYYMKPTINSEWVNDSRGEYSVASKPGTVFLWVIDNNNQISYAAMSSVIDKVNTDTTLKTLEVKTDSGEKLNTETYAFGNISVDGITSSDYVRLSNELKSDSMIASGFNPFDTAYKVKTTSSKIAVYATLTSNDASYVKGYEPREVELDYGVNTILIKIRNKKGKERTYTIIATREDDRDSSNYLKKISVSEGKIKFDKYTSDYVISVSKNVKYVNINGELESSNAGYVDGYGPRKIELNLESTTAIIKIRSEAGLIRTYTITFVKTGEETTNDKEALLSSLSTSKAYIAFEKNITYYNTTVDYEVDNININAIAENGGDAVNLYRTINGETKKIEMFNVDLNVGSNLITIIVSTKDGKARTYIVNVVRKENGLEISSDTALSMLGVDGYDIEFNPEKFNYEIKIKKEKTLVIAATPMSNRATVYIRGNDNLTAFSIVKIKVVSEDGQFREYTIDIKKDTVNKTIEMIAVIGGVIIIVCGIIIIRVKRKRKSINSYYA